LYSLSACAGSLKKTEHRAASAAQYSSFKDAVNRLDEGEIHRQAVSILENDPDDAFVLTGLAHFYRKTNRLNMAEMLTTRVLRDDPGNLRAKRNLAFLHIDRGQDHLALKVLLEIYDIDRSFPGVAQNISSIYRKYSMNSLAAKYQPATAGVVQ
jgi:tetratricopeptide (TPR) repeat protein